MVEKKCNISRQISKDVLNAVVVLETEKGDVSVGKSNAAVGGYPTVDTAKSSQMKVIFPLICTRQRTLFLISTAGVWHETSVLSLNLVFGMLQDTLWMSFWF